MDQLNVLSLSLAEYKEQIDSLYSSLSLLELGTDEYKQVLESLNSALLAYSEMLTNALSLSDNLSTSALNLNSELTNVLTTAENLNLGNDTFLSLSSDIDNVNYSFSELANTEDTLSTSTDNLTLTISAAGSESNSVAGNFDLLANSLDTASNSLSGLSLESDTVASNLDLLTNNAESISNSLSGLSLESDTVAGDFDLLANSADNTSNSLSGLSLESDTVTSNFDLLTNSVDTTSTSLSDLSLESNSVAGNFDLLTNSADNTSTSFLGLSLESNLVTADLDLLTNNAESISTTFLGLSLESNLVTADLDLLTNSADNTSISFLTLSSDGNLVTTDLDLLTNSADSASTSFSGLSSESNSVAGNFDLLTNSANSTSTSFSGLSSESNTVAGNLSNAGTSATTLSGQMAQAAADSNTLSNSLDNLQNTASSIDTLNTSFSDFNNTVTETNNTLTQTETELDNVNTKAGETSEKLLSASTMSKDFTGVLNTLGVSTKGLATGFNLAENASKGLNSIWQVMAKHPFITVISLLIGLFMKVKNAINSNEEALKKWSAAMAKFLPIVDAVNKVLGWLAEGLATAVGWLGERIPDAISYVGGFLAKLIRGFGSVVSAMGKMASIVPKIWDSIVDIIGDGVGTILNAIAKLADAVGLDSFASSLRNAATAAKNFSLGASAAVEGMANNIVNFINGAADKVDGFTKGVAKSFLSALKAATENVLGFQKLSEDMRAQELANAETEKKVADLRNLAMLETDPAKRLEIYKLMNSLIEENGKKQVELAKRLVELEEQRQSFSPSSKAEGDYLNTLKANVTKTEATVASALTKQIKMIQKLEDALNAASKATTKTAKAEAAKKVKAIEDELKAAIKASADFVKDFKDNISSISQNLSDELKLEESLKSIMETSGKFDLSALIEYENKRYLLTVDANAKIKAEYEKALENEVLTEEDRLKLLSQYNSLIVLEQVDKNKHLAELNKITLTKINKETKEALESLNLEDVALKQINSLVKAFAGLDAGQKAELLKSLSITEEEKNLILADIEVYEQDLLNGTNKYLELLETREHEHLKRMLEIKQANASKLLLAFGAENEQYLTALAEYNLLMEAEEMRHATKMGEIKSKDNAATKKLKEQNLKMYTEYAKALGSIMGGIADIMQNNIEQKRKEGKITEEEANKQFKKVKALQIAETVINTLAGAAGGFMLAVKTYPAPYGAILGGLTSAAALATGFALIQKIRSTELGSSGSSASGGGGMSSVSIGDYLSMGVLPIVDENRDLANMQTIPVLGDSETEEKDTRVYILQSDITDSNNLVQIRQNNTTF